MSLNTRREMWSFLRCSLVASALTVGVGSCLQIKTRIRLHEDGSATITERLQFTERLLDLGRKGESGQDIAVLLTREAAQARVAGMGVGVALVSHEVRDLQGGAREAVTVFKVDDIRNFRYVSPYLASLNYPKHHVLACKMFPCDTDTWYGRQAGQMAVQFIPLTEERRRGKPDEASKPPSPLDNQVLRDLAPLFRDLMEDFYIRLTFESYTRLRFRQYYRYRGRRARTKQYDLIDFSDQDLDKYGYAFLANEEIVLELLRVRMDGQNVVDHVKEHADNLTVPVFHPRGTPEIYFKPSRILFDRYFKGKTLHFDKRRGGDRPAKWEELGCDEALRGDTIGR